MDPGAVRILGGWYPIFSSLGRLDRRQVGFWEIIYIQSEKSRLSEKSHLSKLGPSLSETGIREMYGQIMAASNNLTHKGSWGRETTSFPGNLGWWNIIIWQDSIPTPPNNLGWHNNLGQTFYYCESPRQSGYHSDINQCVIHWLW